MALLEIIVILAVVIVGGFFFIIYNSLVVVRNNVNKAWSDIDVLLEKRYDLIGNLVSTVKGYMKYEKSVLVQVTAMRMAWSNVQGNNVQDKMDTSNQISNTLKTLFADVENYPDLKADQTFMQLQNALVDIENQIADRREYYNDSVNIYNIKISIIPNNLFAGSLGFRPLSLFKAPEEAEQVVKVDLS
jgi:LemA protein